MTGSKHSPDQILKEIGREAQELQARARRVMSLMEKPLETEIGSTPYEVVYREDRIRLKHYRTKGKPKIKTPLLVVYALINRETMLDLQPGRSVVQSFLDAGLDVYMIDWGSPTRKDRFQTIEDHVCGYMDNVVEFIRRRSGSDQVNLMGVCMGGTFSVMYASLFPEKIRNLITTVSPTNFDTDKGLLHLWVRGLDVDRLVDAFGNIPGDMMNFGFLLLNPARLMIDKYVGFLDNADKKEFVENFYRMEKWIFDSPDVPGETFRAFLKDLYQKNLLIKNELVLGGKRVDLRKITMPVLNIYGRFDHLVPPEAAGGSPGAWGARMPRTSAWTRATSGFSSAARRRRSSSPRSSGSSGRGTQPGKPPPGRGRARARRKGNPGRPGSPSRPGMEIFPGNQPIRRRPCSRWETPQR